MNSIRLNNAGSMTKKAWKCIYPDILNHTFKKFSTTCCYRVSFAKQLTLGNMNMNWMLPSPVLENEKDLIELSRFSNRIAQYFTENINSSKMDLDAKCDPANIQDLKDLGLFGQQIPLSYGGLGLSNVKYAHVLEHISADSAITMMLRSHQDFGVKAIMIAGTDEQKQKYLPYLASGKRTAAFCFTEFSGGSDAASLQTTAQLSKDGKQWLLNGKKIWVTNGSFADVMVVFAKTSLESSDNEGEMIDKVTAFIVERSFDGITCAEPDNQLGVRACNTCTVTFENAPVPIENVLEEPGHGFKLAMDIFNNGRFSIGGCVTGQLKRIVSLATEHAHSHVQFGKKLSEFGLVKEKLFNMVMKTYAVESMTYMTAGQMDVIEDDGKPQDCSIEAAMLKIYSSEAAWSCSNECFQIFGGSAYMKDHPLERILRDSRILSILENTNELLSLFVALSMLQYAGPMYRQRFALYKSGNWGQLFLHLRDLIKDSQTSQFDNIPVPESPFRLKRLFSSSSSLSWLHPSLRQSGLELGQSVQAFQRKIYHNLIKYAEEIKHQQTKLKTISDVAINLYAMAAVIARCNKAKILELENADIDVQITKAFVRQTYRDNIFMIHMLSDSFMHDIATQRDVVCSEMQEERRYLCSSPLEFKHKYIENPVYLEQLDKVKNFLE